MSKNRKAVFVEGLKRVIIVSIMDFERTEEIEDFICALEVVNDSYYLVPIFGNVKSTNTFPYFNCSDPEKVLQAVRKAILKELPDANEGDFILISAFW